MSCQWSTLIVLSRPEDGGFPICPKCSQDTKDYQSCQNLNPDSKECCLLDCEGLLAAKRRAAQYGYYDIVKKIDKIAKKKGRWRSNRVHCPEGWEYGDLSYPHK